MLRRFFLLSSLLLVCMPGPLAGKQPLYLQIDTPPAPVLSVAESLDSFAIAPGFEIEAVASEPLVEDPVAVTWDEKGRLYVVEMRGFMPDAWGKGEREPVGAVVRLTDVDDDGIFDHRELLLGKLVLPRAVAIVNEGLLIGEPPNLWLCPSRKAADVDCSKKLRLGEYGNQPGSVEHAENGLLPVLDNWIYNAKSDRRMQLRKGELIIEQTLFRGQWGIAQDNEGALYYNTNSQLLMGDLYDAQPVIRAGNASAPGLGEQFSSDDQLFAVRVNTGVNRAYVPGTLRPDGRLNRPTSASGMVFYRGDQFPAEYRNDVFVAEPAANAVVQLRVARSDLGVATRHLLQDDKHWGRREFLASTDERFRPVDLEVGPDGALYIVDMYRGLIQDHVFLSDELREQAIKRSLDKPLGKGRIWRVRHKSGNPKSVKSTARTVMPDDAADQVALLQHANGWQRDTAQRLLMDANGVDRKLRRLLEEDHLPGSLHALWTLHGRGRLNKKSVQAALGSRHVSMRLAALRAGSSLLGADRLLQLANDATGKSELHHLTLYLAPHNKKSRVLEFLIARLQEVADDPVGRMGVQAAATGNEYELMRHLLAGDSWRAADEQRSLFIEHLVAQSFRKHPDMSSYFLDLLVSLDMPWASRAILAGLARVTRDDGFKVHNLASPHSLFTEPPEHLWAAVAKARQAFTWPGDDLIAGLRPLSPLQKQRMSDGKAWYLERCAICHGKSGNGIAGLGPPLAGSEWVTGPAERLVRIILHGMQGPVSVKGEQWNGIMPGHAALLGFTNEVASGLMTYLHRAWGHKGRIVEPSFIRETRLATADRIQPWTAADLQQLDVNTHYRDYAGTYGGGSFTLKFDYDGEGLNITSVFFNGRLIEEGEGRFRFEPRELRVEFVESDAEKVVGVRLVGQGDRVLPKTGG